MLLRAGIATVVLAVAATVAGGARAADQNVAANSDDEFVPADVTVIQGEKVTWTNTGGSHNVRFDDGTFDSPADPSGPGSDWPVERTFSALGTFAYYCELHGGPNGVGMSGTVTVVAAPGGNPPGSPPPGGGPPGPPAPGGPAPSLPLLKVTLAVSDATPLAGGRVRLFGAVRPARDGRKVQIQRRTRNGGYRTAATTRLRDAGAAKSRFSLRLRVSGDAVFRARVAGDDERAAGVSTSRKVDVHRPRGG